MIRPASYLTTLCAAAIVAQSSFADEIARWDFDSTEPIWADDYHDVKLSVADGKLVSEPTGPDPHFTIKVNGRAGSHRLSFQADFEGGSKVQLYWTTEKDPEISEERSVVESFGPDPDRDFRIYFTTDSPLTSIRFDPPSKRGVVTFDYLRLTDDAPRDVRATAIEQISVADGFNVELLHSVDPEVHGSWVSMTPDPQGRLIVSDQYGKLYRVTPPAVGQTGDINIEPIDIEVGMAQGLLCAFDSLYVMVNGTDKTKQGLWKVSDADGDDKWDTAEHLRHLDGGSEHGPHAVILAPDGKSLYVCAGNHTDLTEFSHTRLPRNWDEDQLLPRMWDAGGHAVGRMAPGGWIAKVSPDGSDWELIGSGFRNEYDIDFSASGELFTYDADMEWDVGTPWYRPTRVNHVTSGAEFGWRSGTGKWPEYYPDSLGSVVDIGPGSPTGIVFGTGAKFPAKYQQALFICDWSYGTIYAVHLTPAGASYSGQTEEFITAQPLPVTDIIVNPVDGAMYFTIGGRRTQSGLYRVTYSGPESTAPASATPVNSLVTLRRELEQLHSPDAENAIQKAWPYLGHEDRHIRYAARIAIEHQPVESWARKAMSERSSVNSTLTALLALARSGGPEHQQAILDGLESLGSRSISEDQSLAALRVLSLALIRLGETDDSTKLQIAATLSSYYPSDSRRLNRELCALLVFLGDPSVVGKTLALMENADTQEEELYYALCLRVMQDYWTIAQRTAYFQWFVKSAEFAGGHSFSGFLKNIREEAIERLSDAEREALKDVLAEMPTPATPEIEANSRPLVKEYTVDELVELAEANLAGRDFENGRRMFQATGCYKCHRFAGRGGIVGPDLSALGRRFNIRNMLESIVEPSKEISDQYVATNFVLDTGQQVVGRVVNLFGDSIMVSENLLAPDAMTRVVRDEIEESFPSKVSLMPTGLLNNLTEDEILDLLAYLKSGGNPESPEFAQR